MSIDATVGTAAVRTNELGIREIVRRLNNGLGPTLVAGLTGSKDRRISHKWAKDEGPEPNAAAVRRLMSAIRLWTELSDAHGEHVARLWFIGSNPWLDEDSPVEAIMEGRFKDVRVAANAMLTGGFSG
ncbi:hypothetical protein GU243_00615 [Pseudarthrobacter psychrotolerans]|uniref:Uncharacterized protein n=1 Tax=Pseudarthrobacter psychrotolerans TaxID=2697569 RepID=A0A6P1NH90_9MICC|nr:hypothetical protein [Pseudarthrobacter psychrotolerans]QHK18533.1 hypothetical protein GU243_00615 [Pseudarthrobacter psychrotolerans]